MSSDTDDKVILASDMIGLHILMYIMPTTCLDMTDMPLASCTTWSARPEYLPKYSKPVKLLLYDQFQDKLWTDWMLRHEEWLTLAPNAVKVFFMRS